jgi:rhamnose utilization protein RhaD (predicted bifunctional aldolase and dehydrogenase)
MPEPLLADLWTDPPAADDLELLRYRSNLLGADLRITNFAGGNTSSKMDLDGVRVLAVKGSGGDLGSITREGFALLDLDKLEALRSQYRGAAFEDEMADLYPRCVVGPPTAPPSIDTPLHAFLPFRHVDHLHPDWAIAIAAARNGREKLAEFNERFRRRVIWLPWMRPGFELGLQMQRAVKDNPGCDGILLANHGLFTWGGTHEECYRSSLRTVEDMGRFVLDHDYAAAARTHRSGHRSLRRIGGRDSVCEFRSGTGTRVAGHKLPRSLYPHTGDTPVSGRRCRRVPPGLPCAVPCVLRSAS